MQRHHIDDTQYIRQFLDTFQTGFAGRQDLFQGFQLFLVASLQKQNGLQFVDGFLRDAVVGQFFIDVFQTDFLQFVDGNGDFGEVLFFAQNFGDTAQNLAVVQFDANTDAETTEHFIDNLQQFHFVHQRVAAHHVGVTLVEFAITAFLRTVGSPNRLNLITFEGESDIVAMHHHIAGKRNGQVVTQTLLAQLLGEKVVLTRQQIFVAAMRKKIAGIKNLEQ